MKRYQECFRMFPFHMKAHCRLFRRSEPIRIPHRVRWAGVKPLYLISAVICFIFCATARMQQQYIQQNGTKVSTYHYYYSFLPGDTILYCTTKLLTALFPSKPGVQPTSTERLDFGFSNTDVMDGGYGSSVRTKIVFFLVQHSQKQTWCTRVC